MQIYDICYYYFFFLFFLFFFFEIGLYCVALAVLDSVYRPG